MELKISPLGFYVHETDTESVEVHERFIPLVLNHIGKELRKPITITHVFTLSGKEIELEDGIEEIFLQKIRDPYFVLEIGKKHGYETSMSCWYPHSPGWEEKREIFRVYGKSIFSLYCYVRRRVVENERG